MNGYDALLAATLVLPPTALFLLGKWLERGLDSLDTEARVRRGYLMSKLTSAISSIQIIGVMALSISFGDEMALMPELWNLPLDALSAIGQVSTPWLGLAIALVIMFGLLGANLLLLMLPSMRLSQKIRKLTGVTRTHIRLSARATLLSFVPMMIWLGIVFALPSWVISSPTLIPLLLAAFLAVLYSVAPLLVAVLYPTERMADEHPVVQMAQELCRQAGVRVTGIRILKFGELKVANAMVSGLLPWFRRIYVSDTMLETFTLNEIRAVLAHEVGHVKHRHLFYYLVFALAASPIIQVLNVPLAGMLGKDWVVLGGMGGLLVYWGVIFSFASRIFERQADRYALQATGDVQTLQAALEKLATVNGAVKKYSKWDIFNTHPAVSERIRAIS